jgi:hypothetical protein
MLALVRKRYRLVAVRDARYPYLPRITGEARLSHRVNKHTIKVARTASYEEHETDVNLAYRRRNRIELVRQFNTSLHANSFKVRLSAE